VGSILTLQNKKPTAKIKDALAKLNELPAEAQKELKTMEDLKKEVNRLTVELKKQKAPAQVIQQPTSKRDIEKIQNLERLVNEYKVTIKQEADQNQRLTNILNGVKKSFLDIQTIAVKYLETKKQILPRSDKSVAVRSSAPFVIENAISRERIGGGVPVKIIRPVAPAPDGSSLGKCARAIILFLGQYADRQFSKTQISIATGYSQSSSGFQNSLSQLNTMGFIIRGAKISINPEAISEITGIVGEIEPRQYDISAFRDNLQKCEREIYDVILDDPGHKFTKQEIADLTPSQYSITSSGFQNALSKLCTLEILVRQGTEILLNPEQLEFILD
jgi:phage host-nuclease inhibitor protein Gam